MKKHLAVLFSLLIIGAASSQAAQRSLTGSRGGDVTADYVGAKVCGINNSTGTSAVLCVSGRGLIYGVISSSITQNGAFVVFRDSDTANTSSSSFTFVNRDNEVCTGGAGITCMNEFPVPIYFSNGLSADSSQNLSDGGMWSILYRGLD